MIKFIDTYPKCDCGGELAIEKIVIDLPNCNYTIFSNCIVCGEEHIILLQLTDFIEISQIVGGSNEP